MKLLFLDLPENGDRKFKNLGSGYSYKIKAFAYFLLSCFGKPDTVSNVKPLKLHKRVIVERQLTVTAEQPSHISLI